MEQKDLFFLNHTEFTTSAAITLTIYNLGMSPSSEKSHTLSTEGTAELDEIVSTDSMSPTANDSKSVCVYQFDIENRSYLLNDSLDYVDAIVRESEDDYKYYGKHLSDAEIESLRSVCRMKHGWMKKTASCPFTKFRTAGITARKKLRFGQSSQV